MQGVCCKQVDYGADAVSIFLHVLVLFSYVFLGHQQSLVPAFLHLLLDRRRPKNGHFHFAFLFL